MSRSPRRSTASPFSLERYLDDLTTTLSDGWNRFWFTPSDPATLGMIRILTGLMLVYTHWVWGLEFDTFFGVHSWTSAEVVHQFQLNDFSHSFWWFVPPQWGLAVHYACLAVLVLFLLGAFTRITSIAALIIVISYAYRVPTALFGLDQINGMLTLYCAIGPSGRAYSVDNWLRQRRNPTAPVGLLAGERLGSNPAGDTLRLGQPEQSAGQAGLLAGERLSSNPAGDSIGANIAIRLIQLHMCLIYFFAGVTKLQGETWWNGLAMWYSFANREYQTLNMTWMAEHPLIINALTHITVLWEISFCALIWPRLTRPIMLLFAVLLHAGIGLCLGMWTFGLIMLVGCSSFVSPQLVRSMVDGRLARRRTQRHPVRASAPAAQAPSPQAAPA